MPARRRRPTARRPHTTARRRQPGRDAPTPQPGAGTPRRDAPTPRRDACTTATRAPDTTARRRHSTLHRPPPQHSYRQNRPSRPPAPTPLPARHSPRRPGHQLCLLEGAAQLRHQPGLGRRHFLAPDRGQLAQQLLLLLGQVLGVSTTTVTIRSPRPRPCRCGTPRPRRRTSRPLWVPAGIVQLLARRRGSRTGLQRPGRPGSWPRARPPAGRRRAG